MLDQEKELPNDSGRPLNHNNFTDKEQMATAKKQCFLRFLCSTESSLNVIQSPGFTNDYKFCFRVNKYQ